MSRGRGRQTGHASRLVVRTSALGDVVLALRIARAMARARPSEPVHFLTRAAYAPLAALAPELAGVLTLEGDAGGGGVRGLTTLARSLAATGTIGAVVDLQRGWRGRALARLLGVPRVVPRGQGVARRLLVRSGRLGLPGRIAPRVDVTPAWRRMANAVAPLLSAAVVPLRASPAPLRPPPALLPLLVPEPARLARVREAAGWDGDGGPRVVLCLGARGEKRWPRAHYAELSARLAAGSAARVVLVSDAGPEPSTGPASAPAVAPESGRVLRAPLADLAALFAESDVVVGGDSGLAHLAQAVGAPTVVLFGPTVPALGFAPLGPRDVVLERNLGCRPCSVHGTRRCWRGDHACLTGLPPREVGLAVARILTAARTATPSSAGDRASGTERGIAEVRR